VQHGASPLSIKRVLSHDSMSLLFKAGTFLPLAKIFLNTLKPIFLFSREKLSLRELIDSAFGRAAFGLPGSRRNGAEKGERKT